jgi:hypothetical protein
VTFGIKLPGEPGTDPAATHDDHLHLSRLYR